ncbi:alpha/beta hydrolase [soil metagenome]
MSIKINDSTIRVGDDNLHIYTWQNRQNVAQRIVVLIHGLLMHGRSFAGFAPPLAQQESIVIAPDLRGFGQSYFGSDGEKNRTNFSKSLDDISQLLIILKNQHPHLPIFLVGESLGSHFALSAAAKQPDLVNGLILSSPCVRPRMLSIPLVPHICTQLMLSGLRQFNLSLHAKDFLKNEPESLQHYLDDPMSRKSLEVLELIDSLRFFGSNTPKEISPDLPVLVLRGKNDCVCNVDSTMKFLESIKSRNLTFHSCGGCGHLILQAAKIDMAILDTIVRWLKEQSNHSDGTVAGI